MYYEVQEAEHAEHSPADSGGNGEPSRLDNLASNCPTGLSHTHADECETDIKTDECGDHEEMASKSCADVDSARDKRGLQGEGLGDSLCDGSNVTDDHTMEEDVTTVCADISSGVSHIDIDVSKEAGDPAISPGI